MTKINKRLIKAWERFDDDLNAFIKESEGDNQNAEAILYEDAFTTRSVRTFIMAEDGELIWIEDGKLQTEQMRCEEEAREYLSFWRGCLRRAKKYWSMDSETLDQIQDGLKEDEEE